MRGLQEGCHGIRRHERCNTSAHREESQRTSRFPRDRELPTVKALSRYVRLSHAPSASLVAYKTSADVVSKTVTLIVTVAAARTLAPGDFGVMALAMTTGWLLGVASDAGLPMYLATRLARARAAGQPEYPLAQAALHWRSRLAAAAAIGAVLAGAWLVPLPTLAAFTLIVLHQLFGAMLETIGHAFRGLGRTDIESSLSLAHRGAVALTALAVLATRPSLLALGIALAVPPLAATIAARAVLKRIAEDGPPTALTARDFLTNIAPLGAGVLLSALYFRCDVYFLERLHGVELVGLYNAAFRIVDALRLFPAALLAVAYPMMCAATDYRRVVRISNLLLVASGLVGVTLYLTAPELLALVYGSNFASAGQALRVLALCVPFFYVNYALTHQLIAWGHERRFLWIACAALVANLAGNALLIPDGGMAGAAISTLGTEVVVFVGALVALVRR